MVAEYIAASAAAAQVTANTANFLMKHTPGSKLNQGLIRLTASMALLDKYRHIIPEPLCLELTTIYDSSGFSLLVIDREALISNFRWTAIHARLDSTKHFPQCLNPKHVYHAHKFTRGTAKLLKHVQVSCEPFPLFELRL
jgi:hypothetical protein